MAGTSALNWVAEMSDEINRQNLAIHLRGLPAPVEVSHAYRLRLTLVLVALALLQGLYLALIGVVVWLGWNGTLLLSGFWSNGFAAFLVLMCRAAVAAVATISSAQATRDPATTAS